MMLQTDIESILPSPLHQIKQRLTGNMVTPVFVVFFVLTIQTLPLLTRIRIGKRYISITINCCAGSVNCVQTRDSVCCDKGGVYNTKMLVALRYGQNAAYN